MMNVSWTWARAAPDDHKVMHLLRESGLASSDVKAEIDALREENESIQGLKEQYRGSVPLTWVAGVIALCLVVGFLVGLWWVDHRSRKRHGGIRIY